MKIRFQADADLNADIVAGIRRRAPLIDIQSADEAGLQGIPDPLVLAYTAQERRILISHDQKTMTQPSPGLFHHLAKH